MSVFSTIDVCIANDVPNYCEVIDVLRRAGWTPAFEGQITYLPLGDNDRFDWTAVPASEEPSVAIELQRKCESREMLGIVLVWEDSECGGEFLVFPDGKFSIILSVNRRSLAGFERSTDVSWYVHKLLISFEKSPLHIESIGWQSHSVL